MVCVKNLAQGLVPHILANVISQDDNHFPTLFSYKSPLSSLFGLKYNWVPRCAKMCVYLVFLPALNYQGELYSPWMRGGRRISYHQSPLHERTVQLGFPHSLVGKESTCNAGDPSSITGSGRFPGEEIGYPFQYSWVSLVAQLGKNLLAMQETWVPSLSWEDPLEKGKATHSHILSWRII